MVSLRCSRRSTSSERRLGRSPRIRRETSWRSVSAGRSPRNGERQHRRQQQAIQVYSPLPLHQCGPITDDPTVDTMQAMYSALPLLPRGLDLLSSNSKYCETFANAQSPSVRREGLGMATPTITNWFGDLISHPRVVVEATSVDDIVKVLKDPVAYPSPVRAVGSNHSTAPVGVAEGGTLIQMSGMNRILEIGKDTVTVQAGAIAARYRPRAGKARAAILREHGNRQPLGGQRGVRRHQGRFHARRIRPGGLVHHAHQDGAAIGRTPGSHRTINPN